MKKNFLMVAALLIAAMLMVVSCKQEVAPKNDGLVEVIFGVGRSSRDVGITDSNQQNISYTYKLSPEWSMVQNGTPIYGAKEKETPIEGLYTISQPVEKTNLGLITPGLWKIEVFGYVGTDLVLKGERTQYFTGNSTTTTVFVAPVSNSNAKGTVSISLKMQDLGEGLNQIDYSIKNLDNRISEVTGSITPSGDAIDNVHSYVKSNVAVNAGFNTITFNIHGKEGGITKTFLMIPGHTATITGSVYPSEFVDYPVTISVIDLSGEVSLVVKDGETVKNKEDVKVTSNPNDNSVVNMYVLEKEKEYTFKWTESESITFPEQASSITRAYKWFVGGKEIQNLTSESVTSSQLGIKGKSGDFAITCVVTYTYSVDSHPYSIEASVTEGKVRVK